MSDRKPLSQSDPSLTVSGRFPKVRRTLFAFAPQIFRELVRRDRKPVEPLPGARASQPIRAQDD
jgi:hypothetical protein